MSSYHIVIKTGRWLRWKTARDHIISALGVTHYSKLKRISHYPQIWQLDFPNVPWGVRDRLRNLGPVKAVYVDYHPDKSDEGCVLDEKTARTPDAVNGKTKLLSLSAELRNEIYRLVLVEDNHIKIRDNLPEQPALLRACRQTRQEGLNLYFQENYFVFYIEHFDASRYLQWCKASRNHYECNHGFMVADSANWDNLLRWLEAYYKGECKGTTVVYKPKCRKGEVAACLFNVMRALGDYREIRVGDLTWDVFQRMFDEMRRALETRNNAWRS